MNPASDSHVPFLYTPELLMINPLPHNMAIDIIGFGSIYPKSIKNTIV